MTAIVRQDEKVLINACSDAAHQNSSFANETGALPSAPMPIGDALIDALEAAAPDSVHPARIRTAIHVLSVASQVLKTDTFSQRTHAAARHGLAKLDHVTIKGLLTAILDAADGSEYIASDWRSATVERINDFALFLRNVGYFAPASEVYARAAQIRRVAPKVTMAALQGRGWTLRQLGDHFRAERAYQTMRAVAEDACDMIMALEADLGRAKVAIERGNLAEAEPLALDVMRRAKGIGLSRVTGLAHIDLACIAGIRMQYGEAVVHLDRARSENITRVDHDLCGINMAEGQRMLRRVADACASAHVVARTAEGLEERVGAWLILYHLAMDQGHDADAHRERLADIRMSAQKRAELYEANARDAWCSDDLLTARRELADGLAFAEAHKLNEMIMHLDDGLKHLEHGKEPPRFLAPNHLPSPATAAAIRRIGYDARKAEAAWMREEELRANATGTGHPPRLLVETFVHRVVASGR